MFNADQLKRLTDWLTDLLTFEEVSGTQVDVDAGVKARDEAVESPFLHTLTCRRHRDKTTVPTRRQTFCKVEYLGKTSTYLPASCGRPWLQAGKEWENCDDVNSLYEVENCGKMQRQGALTFTPWAAVQHTGVQRPLDGVRSEAQGRKQERLWQKAYM